MAHLWTRLEANEDWTIVPLDGDHHQLARRQLSPPSDGSGADSGRPSVLVVRRRSGKQDQWVLLSRVGGNVRVNGQLLVLGTRVLRDRDEILLSDNGSGEWRRYYFSLERPARATVFPAAQGPMVCPRCKQPLRHGETAVQCPNPHCGTWHHQNDKLPCWTYSATCALCDQPTPLDTGYRWTPETL